MDVTAERRPPVSVRACARREGRRLAPSYWPTLVRRANGHGRREPGALVVAVGPDEHLLLLATDSPAGDDRVRLMAAIAGMAGPAPAVVGAPVGPDRAPAAVAAHLGRVAPHALQPLADGVACAPCHALAWVTRDPRHAAALMGGQIAGLLAHDRAHGTQLAHVLELALDHPTRDAAAEAAAMHRNTFRRQLRAALDLVGIDLACPDERLALHLALKLRAGWC